MGLPPGIEFVQIRCISGVIVHFSAFRLPGSTIAPSFLAISPSFEKYSSPLNSATLSKRMDETYFQRKPIFRVWGFPFTLLIWWVEIPKGTLSEHTLFIGAIGLQWNFLLWALRRIPEILPFLVLAIHQQETFGMFYNSRLRYPIIVFATEIAKIHCI